MPTFLTSSSPAKPTVVSTHHLYLVEESRSLKKVDQNRMSIHASFFYKLWFYKKLSLRAMINFQNETTNPSVQ